MMLSVFLLIILSMFIASCSAAAPCPVRAVFAPILGGDGNFACVCRRNFYGDKCQFQAQNRSVLELNATWRKDNTAAVTWHAAYSRKFQLSVRRAKYDTGVISYGKWRKAVVNFIVIRMEIDGNQDLTTSLGDAYIALAPRARFTAQLGLIQDLSYEVRLVEVNTGGESNLTASVFLDAVENVAFDEKHNLNTTKNEDKPCTWYACPARFFHITAIWNDFGNHCFIHRAIFAVASFIVAAILAGILVYIAVRQYKHKQGKPTLDSTTKSLKTKVPSVVTLK